MSKRRPHSGPSSADRDRRPKAESSPAAKPAAAGKSPVSAPPVPRVPAGQSVEQTQPADRDTGESVPGRGATGPHTATAVTGHDAAADSPSAPGRTELGRIDIDDRVVEKIAARAVTEIPDAGAAAPRVLGRSLAGLAGHTPGGVRQTSLDDLPKTSADVDGTVVTLDLQISVRWPCSVPEVTAAVRRHVHDRVGELTGLDVRDVRIQVTDLVTHLAPPARVH